MERVVEPATGGLPRGMVLTVVNHLPCSNDLKDKVQAHQRKQRGLNQHLQQRIKAVSSDELVEELVVERTKKHMTAMAEEVNLARKEILRLSRRLTSL